MMAEVKFRRAGGELPRWPVTVIFICCRDWDTFRARFTSPRW
jgi:hypothetical protein